MCAGATELTIGFNQSKVTCSDIEFASDETISDKNVVSDGIITFENVAGCDGGGFKIVGAIAKTYCTGTNVPPTKTYKLYLFDSSVTPPARNSAWGFDDSDRAQLNSYLGEITFDDWVTVASSQIATCHGQVSALLGVENSMYNNTSIKDKSIYGVLWQNDSSASSVFKAGTVMTIELIVQKF